MILPRPDLHWVEPLAFWDFRNIFLPNTGEDEKKVLSEGWAHGTVPYVFKILQFKINRFPVTLVIIIVTEDDLWECWLTFIENKVVFHFETFTLFYDSSAAKYLWKIENMQSIFEILFAIGNRGKISKGKKPF